MAVNPLPLTRGGQLQHYITYRSRPTKALVKKKKQAKLVEEYENAAEILRRERLGLLDTPLGPSTMARVRKIYALSRAELFRRGATKEDLDYEPEEEADEPDKENDHSL